MWLVAIPDAGVQYGLGAAAGKGATRRDGLCASLAAAVGQHSAYLDGEIVAPDASGRADFYPLLYRRAEPYFSLSIASGSMPGSVCAKCNELTPVCGWWPMSSWRVSLSCR
jgi:hypothetical protein